MPPLCEKQNRMRGKHLICRGSTVALWNLRQCHVRTTVRFPGRPRPRSRRLRNARNENTPREGGVREKRRFTLGTAALRCRSRRGLPFDPRQRVGQESVHAAGQVRDFLPRKKERREANPAGVSGLE